MDGTTRRDPMDALSDPLTMLAVVRLGGALLGYLARRAHLPAVTGQVLATTLAYEQSIWNEAACPGLDTADMREAYMDALIFTRDARRCFADPEAA